MSKTPLASDEVRNGIISNVIALMEKNKSFLVLGHKNPDEDCVASMVAFSLLLGKMSKKVCVYFSGQLPENLEYLTGICKYNLIGILKPGAPPCDCDTIVVCDTAKPDMIDMDPYMKELVDKGTYPIIEIDHHTGSDSQYAGHEDYRLVDAASSACELVGGIALEINSRKELLEEYHIENLFTRNLVLSLLTGIVGDSGMGKYLKSDRERENYRLFSSMYNDILKKETTRETNISSMDEIFSEIKRVSGEEEECYNYCYERVVIEGSLGYVALDEKETAFLYDNYDDDVVRSVTRNLADYLAEESGKVGMVSYYDDPSASDLIQFRMRRSMTYHGYDLRNFLQICSIENGGGHEGAIGFRFPKSEIDDYREYIEKLKNLVNKEL